MLRFEVFKPAARISASSLPPQVTKRRACDDMSTSVCGQIFSSQYENTYIWQRIR